MKPEQPSCLPCGPAGTRRRSVLGALALLALHGRARPAPVDALHLLCSGPAGSIPDIIARAVGDQLSATAGLRAWVDNRPGAAGQISVAALKNAPADGSTLLLAQGAIATIYPHLYSKLAYDPMRDLQPVSMACEMTLALAVGPAVPDDVRSLPEFLAWARLHPRQANFGSPGIGTLPHILQVMLMGREGAGWQHVAYAGGPPALTDLVGGRIAALVLPEGLLRQQHAVGRVRVLATSGPRRSAYLPDVPTLVEQGHPGLVVKEWFAFFAPAGTPRPTLESTSAVLREALNAPAVAAAFAQAGMSPSASRPAELSERIASEQRLWQPVLRAHDIRVD